MDEFEDINSEHYALNPDDSVYKKPEQMAEFYQEIREMLAAEPQFALRQQEYQRYLFNLLDASTLTDDLLTQTEIITKEILPGLLKADTSSVQEVFFWTLLSLSIASKLIFSEHNETKRDQFRRFLLEQLLQLEAHWPKNSNEGVELTAFFRKKGHPTLFISRANFLKILANMGSGYLKPVPHEEGDDDTSAALSEAEDEDVIEEDEIQTQLPPRVQTSSSVEKTSFSSTPPPNEETNPFYKIHLYFIKKIQEKGDFQGRLTDFSNLLNLCQISKDEAILAVNIKSYQKSRPSFSGGVFKLFRDNRYNDTIKELLELPSQGLMALYQEYNDYLEKISTSKSNAGNPDEITSISIAQSIMRKLQSVPAHSAGPSAPRQ